MILDGEFFSVKSKDYNKKTLNCVVQAVEKLNEIDDKPLMMLGKIQSGKNIIECLRLMILILN